MTGAMGVVDVAGAIPRIRHMQLPGESIRDHMGRIAEATSFAYRIDPDRCAAQPGFSYSAGAILLPNGTVVRGDIRGRVQPERDAALVAAGGGASLFVYLLHSGRIEMRPSRRGALGPGGILIHDLGYPAELVLEGYAVTILVIGGGALSGAVRDRDVNGAVVRHDHPLARLVSAMIEELHTRADEFRPDHATAVLDHALALLSMALESVTIAARAKLPVKAAAEALIDGRLDDPELSPATIADLLGISRATLYRAFQAYGRVRRVVAGRRLHRAWTLATSENGPSPNDIARVCGFRGTARMNHAMREGFGAELHEIRDASESARAALLAPPTFLVEENRRRVTGRD